MKRWSTFLSAAIAVAAIGLAGCGGSKSSTNPPVDPPVDPPVNPTPTDRDGDGIPNTQDGFPDDPTRFSNHSAVLLGRVGGTFGAAVAINDSNVVVGMSDDGTGAVKAVRWTVTGTTASAPEVLSPLVQNNYSAAYGIGADGTVVGESEKATDFVPVIWPAGTTTAVELGLGTLVAPAAAYAIDGARIVGEATNAGKPVAVVWAGSSSAPVALPGIGGDSSSAYAAMGAKVVGELTTSDGSARGAVWTLDASGNAGAPAVLPPLTGHVSSIALGVNGAGDVVGESTSAAGEVHAVVWTVDAAGVTGPPVDLGTGSASAVNDLDFIAGYRGGTNQPTLWTLANLAIPDPLFSGSFAFTQVYGMNAASAMVGIANDQGFVALPQ